MQDNVFNVAFRRYEDGWEAYGVNAPFYGHGKSLLDAKNDVKEAIEALTDIPVEHIKVNEFHERCIAEETSAHPAVWVRAYQDQDSHRMLTRRRLVEDIKTTLADNPEYIHTFDNGVSSFGDTIALACFADDMFIDVLNQVGEATRVFVCMPDENNLYWQCIFTDDAENKPDHAESIESLNLGDGATVGDFMQATHANETSPKEFLLAA